MSLASESLDRARQLLETSLVWNNHTCFPLRAADDVFLPEIERERKAGFNVTSLNVGFGPQPLESHIRVLASMREWFERHSDRYTILRSPADIDTVRERGSLGVFFDVEGMAFLNGVDEGIVALLADLGVRWMSIAYNKNNAVGGGCLDDDPGLTPFGRDVLQKLRHAGIAIDCSHTGHRTVRDVLEASDGPVIFSHSNCSAVHEHPRNIPDDLLRACAQSGGVIGINGIGAFLSENDDDLVSAFVKHVDHAVRVAGVDHVGLALDYVYDTEELLEYIRSMRDSFPNDAAFARPVSMVAPEQLTDIVVGLCDLGYDDDTIRKILGLNWRRVAEALWR
jgi:membrane dipeptidase